MLRKIGNSMHEGLFELLFTGAQMNECAKSFVEMTNMVIVLKVREREREIY